MTDADRTRGRSTPYERVTQGFIEMTGMRPAMTVRAPGRVNLIGDHTDYNDGFVLPMAIDRATFLAFAPGDDDVITVRSLDVDDTRQFAVGPLTGAEATRPGARSRSTSWIDYARGVVFALAQAGVRVRGFRATVASNLPIGAGLSSSAAFELAIARAVIALADAPWQPRAMARVAQRAEVEWVGVNCGIMDQLVCAAGERDRALLIDCRSLAVEPLPLPADVAVVILDTGTRRGLVDSAYGARRERCERAARTLGVAALRDVNPDALFGRRHDLDPVAYRRARHVVTENQRTLDAAAALRAGDAARVGQLMDGSHASLAGDYEVSSPALDTMVACARAHECCLGARLTGAGFAGCVVALCAAADAEAFARAVVADYTGRMGTEVSPASPARGYVCRADAGAELFEDGSEL